MDKEFANHVRDALAHLYDPVRLQTNPLVELMALAPSRWSTEGKELRTVLRNCIEELQPPASVPHERREWVSYQVLRMRYVRLRSELDICTDLGISQATYYRRQHEAMAALVSILWERGRRQDKVETPDANAQAVLPPPGKARKRAIGLLETSGQQSIDVAELLESVMMTIQPFAAEQNVKLCLKAPMPPRVYGRLSVLRQILISILADSVKLLPCCTLGLTVDLADGEMTWKLWGIGPTPESQVERFEDASTFALSRELLEAEHGRLWVEENADQQQTVLFRMPGTRPSAVLVIDDDPATITLYRRYLQEGDYVVLDGSTTEETESLLTRTQPDIVLLDVMMPHADGWSILRDIRSLATDFDIPVIICSVVDQPSLALALGASAVLAKPISQESLLRTVDELLGRKDTTF